MANLFGRLGPRRWFLAAGLAVAVAVALFCILRRYRSSPPGIPTAWSELVNGLSFRLEAPAKMKAGAELKVTLTIRNTGALKSKFFTGGTWVATLSPQEKDRPVLFSSDVPCLEREGSSDGPEVLELAPGTEEKRGLRCSQWCPAQPLSGVSIRPPPGKYFISIAYNRITGVVGVASRGLGHCSGTSETRQTEIEVEDCRGAEGQPANGLTAALSVSPTVLDIPSDPAKPPVCPFILSVDISSTGTGETGKRLRLVPIMPDALEITDERNRPVVYYAVYQDWYQATKSKGADFPEIGTSAAARTTTFKLEGLLGCDGAIYMHPPGYLKWRTVAHLPPGTYRLRAVYENYEPDRSGSNYTVRDCWVGRVVSNAVTVRIGKLPPGLITAERAAEIGLKEIRAQTAWDLKPHPEDQPVLVNGCIWRITASDPVPSPAMGGACVDIDARTGKVLKYTFIPGE
jgi:hypothetical protein